MIPAGVTGPGLGVGAGLAAALGLGATVPGPGPDPTLGTIGPTVTGELYASGGTATGGPVEMAPLCSTAGKAPVGEAAPGAGERPGEPDAAVPAAFGAAPVDEGPRAGPGAAVALTPVVEAGGVPVATLPGPLEQPASTVPESSVPESTQAITTGTA